MADRESLPLGRSLNEVRATGLPSGARDQWLATRACSPEVPRNPALVLNAFASASREGDLAGGPLCG